MAVHTDDVIEFYDYFFNKKYGSCFKLSKTDKNLKQCNDFLTYCNNLHGVTGKFFLFNYFAFQFQYWDEIELKGGSAYSRQIQLSFIIGKKAFDRYKNRNQEYDWQFKSFPVLKNMVLDNKT